MLGERPPRSVDEAIAIGERLSAVFLRGILNATGIRARAVNGSDVIVTDAVFGNASPQMGATKTRCAERLLPMHYGEALCRSLPASTAPRRMAGRLR